MQWKNRSRELGNAELGPLVTIKEETLEPGMYGNAAPSNDHSARYVHVKTARWTSERPVQELVILPVVSVNGPETAAAPNSNWAVLSNFPKNQICLR